MRSKGICLRPLKDFEWAGVEIPETLDIDFFVPESEKHIIVKGRSAEFIIASSHNPPITRGILKNLNNLKVVQLTGAGYNTVDLAAANHYGVPVAHAPDQNSKSVAQYVFIIAGVLLRRLLEANNQVKQGRFIEARKELKTPTLHEFDGQHLGIIGMGRIGREVAKIGNFFNCRLGYYDILKLTPEVEDTLGVKYFNWQEIFNWADIITLHLPLNPSTQSLIGKKEFKLMKPSAILINISRGGIVDEQALCKALMEKKIRGAGIDVFNEEPPPQNHSYFKLKQEVQERLLLSPHMGGRTIEANHRMFSFAVENVGAFLVDGKALKCVVNLERLKKGEMK